MVINYKTDKGIYIVEILNFFIMALQQHVWSFIMRLIVICRKQNPP